MWRDPDSRVAPVHGKTCRISVQNIQISSGLLEMCEFPVISPAMCFTWNATCHAVLCSCTWIVHVTVCAVGLQWHKMCRKCPEHPSSFLLTTAAEKNKVYTVCYFFACLVFSAHDMNVFVTDFTVDYVVTHVQGFSSGFLTIFSQKLFDMWSNLNPRIAHVHGKMCSISVQNMQISGCTSQYVWIHSNFSNNLFLMKCHISQSSL